MPARIPRHVEDGIIIDYVDHEMTCSEAGDKWGVSDLTVSNVLKRNRIKARPSNYRKMVKQKKRDEVVAERVQGTTLSEIAKRHGISVQSVQNICDDAGMKRQNNFLSREQIQQIVDLYQKVKASRKVAEIVGCDHTTVIRVIEDAGITKATKRTKFFNEGRFKRRTREGAYWMGFIMADGSLGRVGKNSWQLTIGLHRKDHQHLLNFCRWIELPDSAIRKETQGPLKSGGGQRPKSVLVIAHLDLANWMKPWGIIPRKSYDFIAPTISAKYYADFLRGWFDGDGHLSIRNSSVESRIAGNKPGMHWYAKALKTLGYDGNIRVYFQTGMNGSAWYLYTGGKTNLFEFADVLRATDQPRLDRKWLPLFAIQKKHEAKLKERNILDVQIVRDYSEAQMTYDAIAVKYSIAKTRVKSALDRMQVKARPPGPQIGTRYRRKNEPTS